MEFEWDPVKCESNRLKHGRGFEDATRLWSNGDSVRIGLNYQDEQRYIVTGVIDGKHWSAICTDRNGRVRIISFRRAHKKEEEIYENSNRA